MRNKNTRIWAYILGIIPIIVLACVYTHLPEQVPMHWGINGEVEYSAKWQVWIMFSLGPILTILFDVLPKIDPKRKNYEKFGQYYDLFIIVMLVFLMIMDGIMLLESFLPGTISVGKVVFILIGILFAILGNILPKIKTNFYMGIRTPWALTNSDVWNKTQRLGGKIMFVVGLISIVSGMLLSEFVCFVIMMISVACMTIVPLVMSYVWYCKLEK